MDRAKFDQLWARLRQYWKAWPEQKDEVLQSIYYKRLLRYTNEAVEIAVARCVDECQHFPKVAQIIERLPDNAVRQSAGASMEAMNEAIRRKQEADRCIYKVTWLTDPNSGAITGYRLEREGGAK